MRAKVRFSQFAPAWVAALGIVALLGIGLLRSCSSAWGSLAYAIDAGERRHVTANAVGPEGATVVHGRILADGRLTLGCETYYWSAEDGLYVGEHVPATFDPKPNGSLEGHTGTPPNVRPYTGTWSRP